MFRASIPLFLLEFLWNFLLLVFLFFLFFYLLLSFIFYNVTKYEVFMNAFQRFFFNLFLLCFGLGIILFGKINCYAAEQSYIARYTGYNGDLIFQDGYFEYYKSNRTCICVYDQTIVIYSLTQNPINLSNTYTYLSGNNAGATGTEIIGFRWSNQSESGLRFYSANFPVSINRNFSGFNIPVFDSFSEVIQYLHDGIEPELPFDSTLELDSFVVNTYGTVLDNELEEFTNYFVCNWTDNRITTVRVRIDSSRLTNDFTSSVSPFTQSFNASDYASLNGDVITLTATPYNSNGGYGPSLYYSFVYDGNSLIHNLWRKFVNTDKNRNVIEIPYNSVPKSYPVDGVTTNYNYKVNYNPVTNEYGDLNLYQIYYSPVILYPEDTPSEEIDDTQEQVVNNYTTNNYYETTKNFNLNFDIDFGDISTNDIGEGFNGVSGFFNGFGGFIGHLSNWILALLPFLPPIVATSIVFMFGLVILIAGIALILKIIGAIGNIIDAILPL